MKTEQSNWNKSIHHLKHVYFFKEKHMYIYIYLYFFGDIAAVQQHRIAKDNFNKDLMSQHQTSQEQCDKEMDDLRAVEKFVQDHVMKLQKQQVLFLTGENQVNQSPKKTSTSPKKKVANKNTKKTSCT